MTAVPIPPISTPIFDGTNQTFTQPWYNYLGQVSSSSSSGRTKLTADTTYYVRTDGNDGNAGTSNTAGGAFKTVTGAMTYIKNGIDVDGYLVTVQVGAGTYAERINLPTLVGAQDSNPPVLKGDTTTPANVILDGTGLGGSTVIRFIGHSWRVQGFKIKADLTAACLEGHAGGYIRFSDCEFNTCGYCTLAAHRGTIEMEGNFKISASPSLGIAMFAFLQGYIFTVGSYVVTISGTPAWSTAFAYCTHVSLQAWTGMTFSGSATGARYVVVLNSVIDTNGGGANFFPGNSAGASSTGGQYN